MLLPLLSLLAAAALPPAIPRAVATGDCTEVVRLTEDLGGLDARVVRGRCQRVLGDPAAAVQTLAPVTAGPYADYAAIERARALLDLDRAAEAHETLAGVVVPGRAGLEARLLRARALIAQGESLQARSDLRLLLTTDVEDEARYWLAVGAEDRGDLQPAIATYRRVWIDSTRGPWSDRAVEALARLGETVPDPSTDTGRALVRERIRRLDRAYRYDESLALRRALAEHDPVDTPAEHLTMAKASFKGRDYGAAIAHYAAVHGAPTEASGAPAALFDHALATSRTGDYATAAVIYQRLIDQHPGHRKADTASYKLGYLHVDRAEWAPARTALRAHIEARPDSAHLDEAWWWIGWSHFVEERPAEAVEAWAALVEARPRSSLVAAARYWSARARGQQGDDPGEKEGLQEVLRRHPVSGYAWFAAERLGATHPARPLASRPPWPGDEGRRSEIRLFDALLAVGLLPEARDVLLPHRRRLQSSGRDLALASAWAFIEAGAYRTGQAIARPFCVSPWDDGDPVAQQACWPRPAAEVVTPMAAERGIPALVPYGIMTTESALDPDVTSLAGARGLMQLMPDEAEGWHAPLYPGRPYHPDLLYSAPYNASLGVAELGEKLEKVGDAVDGPDIVAAIAAYNGGEAAVARWVEALGGHPDFDRFAEQIGYTETRRYVRKVLGTVMAYRYVYGDTPASGP